MSDFAINITNASPVISANVDNSAPVITANITETGPRGETGEAATVSVGTVTTGAAGSSAAVSNTGTEYAAVLDFTIPQGIQGVSPTVDVKTNTDSAYVLTITDTDGAYDTPNLKEAKYVTDQNTGSLIKVWFGTVAEFNALLAVDEETEYNILEET